MGGVGEDQKASQIINKYLSKQNVVRTVTGQEVSHDQSNEAAGNQAAPQWCN